MKATKIKLNQLVILEKEKDIRYNTSILGLSTFHKVMRVEHINLSYENNNIVLFTDNENCTYIVNKDQNIRTIDESK